MIKVGDKFEMQNGNIVKVLSANYATDTYLVEAPTGVIFTFNAEHILKYFKPVATTVSNSVLQPGHSFTVSFPPGYSLSASAVTSNTQENFDDWLMFGTEPVQTSKYVCQCGTEKTYPNDDTTYMHSSWCAKYVEKPKG